MITGRRMNRAIDPDVVFPKLEGGQPGWRDVLGAVAVMMKPAPDLTPSEWADRYGILTDGADIGRWRCFTYQRAILDSLDHPRIREVSFMKSIRLGWSECLKLIIGYHIHQNPASILAVIPTYDMAKAWSQDIVGSFIEESEVLSEKVASTKGSAGGNSTMLVKRFKGGQLYLRGANAATGLAAISAKLVLFDEIDRFPLELSREGDPIAIGRKRNARYWNGVACYGSTPTVKYLSQIERMADKSDMGYFVLQCPECEADHIRLFREPEEPITIRGEQMPVSVIRWTEPRGRDAAFICPGCGVFLTGQQSENMLNAGRWLADGWDWSLDAGFRFQSPPSERLHIGFRLWAGYSTGPNDSPAELAAEFLEAGKNPGELRTFINTRLGEVWSNEEETTNPGGLMARREVYQADCPAGVLVLVAGADVQKNRIEVSIYGYGRGYECWLIDHEVIPGETALSPSASGGVWKELEDYLMTPFRREGGGFLMVQQALIDSGYQAMNVYDYCKKSGVGYFAARGVDEAQKIQVKKGAGRGALPVKGVGGDRPLTEDRRARARRIMKIRGRERYLETIGTDEAKSKLYAMYSIAQPGPGYVHFPMEADADFFEQLTAEVREVKFTGGRRSLQWTLPSGKANECQDCAVYALAGVFLLSPDFDYMAAARARELLRENER